MPSPPPVSLQQLFPGLGLGCQDNSCVWGRPGGLGTNGGCRCYKYESTFNRVTKHESIMTLRRLITLDNRAGNVRIAVEELVKRVAKEATYL